MQKQIVAVEFCKQVKSKQKYNSSATPNSLKFLQFFPRCSRPEPDLNICTEPSGTSPNLCTGTFRKLAWVCAPQPSGISPNHRTGTFRNLTSAFAQRSGTSPRYLHRNPLEPHLTSVLEPSGSRPGYVHRLEPDLTSASESCGTWPQHLPQPSGTSPRICTRTVRNFPEPDQGMCTGTFRNLTQPLVSAPEPSGTWPTLCTGTFWNLTSASAPEPSGTPPRYLHRNPAEPHLTSVPEPSPEPGVEAAPDRTEGNLG